MPGEREIRSDLRRCAEANTSPPTERELLRMRLILGRGAEAARRCRNSELQFTIYLVDGQFGDIHKAKGTCKEGSMRITHIAVTATIAASLLGSAVQAGMYVYPVKGQSARKQSEDEGICHKWAKQQTGTYPQLIAQAST